VTTTRIPLTSIPREPGFWILFSLTIAFFYRPLFNNETFFFRDLYTHFYPQKKLFAELVLSGQVPLWDPFRHGGQPFLANMNNSVLYPTNLLYLILSPITAFNIDIVLHVLLSSWSAYLLARVLNFNPIASVTCGLIYAFSGPALSIPNVWLYAPFHLPLMILLWHLYCLEGNRRWFFLTALVGAIQVFGGRPELPAITAVTLLLWTLIFPYGQKFKKLQRYILLELFIISLAAIQLIPMMDLVRQSSRGNVVNLHSFFAWSVDPRRFPELTIPGFLGSVYSILESDFWGLQLEDLGMPYILSIYMGVPVLLFAIAGGINNVNDPQFPRRIRILLLLMIVISFIGMTGRHLPGFQVFAKEVPAITIFRYPVKFIFLALLPFSLLAGFYLNQLLENSERQISRFEIALIASVATTLIIFAAYCWLFPAAAENFLRYYFGKAALKGLQNSVLHSAATSLLLALIISYRTIRKKPNITAAISILIGLDLLLAGNVVNQYAPREFLTDVPDLASFIKNEIGEQKLFRDVDRGSVNYRLPSKDRVFADRWRLELLSNYTATMYNIPVVFHEDYDWLEFKRMENLSMSSAKLRWNNKLPIFSSAAVGYVLTAQRFEVPGLKLIRVINNASDTFYFLYKNERCAPRVNFVSNIKIAASTEILSLMTQPSFDPCTTVLLEEETAAKTAGPADASIRILKRNANSSSYFVTSDKPGFLVFSDPFTNGWLWKVDDWNVKPVRANYAFSAVAIPEGKHYVHRVYRPVSIILGLTISFIALAVIIIITFLPKAASVQIASTALNSENNIQLNSQADPES
jgi:hypothetical protein